MTLQPITPGNQKPSQVAGTQSQGSKREFDGGLQQKSEGYTDHELKKAVRDRTKITRTRPVDNNEKKQTLYLVSKNSNAGMERRASTTRKMTQKDCHLEERTSDALTEHGQVNL